MNLIETYNKVVGPATETELIQKWKEHGEKTFDEFLKFAIDGKLASIEFKEKRDSYMSETRKHFAKFDKSYSYMDMLNASLEIKKLNKELTKDVKGQPRMEKELRAAYNLAAQEMLMKIKEQSEKNTMKKVVGVTGPIYDDEENPTYF